MIGTKEMLDKRKRILEREDEVEEWMKGIKQRFRKVNKCYATERFSS